MAIQVNLDVMLARRKMSLTELSTRICISLTALSLDCQPGDILEYVPDQIPETQERSEP
jgi:putative transcriptional regulator